MSSQTLDMNSNASGYPISYYNLSSLVNTVISEGVRKFSYTVKLTTDEDDRVVAKCDNLQGVVTDGADEQEALRNVKEAIDAVLEANNEYKEYNIITYK